MREGKRFLYIHHDVRRIIRVDGKGASLALCIAWVVIFLSTGT